MKKKILFIVVILLLMCPSFVYAYTVYGEYKPYIMDTFEYMEESDTLKREEVTLYNTYEIRNVDLGYLETCENPVEDDFEITSVESASFIPGSVKYQPILAFTDTFLGIAFLDFETKTKVNEIKIYSNGEEVEYTFNGFYQDKFKYLNDGENDTYTILGGNDKVCLRVKDGLLASNVEVVIIGDDLSAKTFVYFKGHNNAEVVKTKANNVYFVNEEEANILKSKYGFVNYGYTDGAGNTYESINPYYLKKIKKHRCYREEKVILNNYVAEGDNIIKDDSQKKYNYYIRTKEEVIDSVIHTTTKSIKKEKKKSENKEVKQTKFEEDEKIEDDIVKVEPLFKSVKTKDKKTYKKVIIIILIIIILQIIVYTLHRKK